MPRPTLPRPLDLSPLREALGEMYSEGRYDKGQDFDRPADHYMPSDEELIEVLRKVLAPVLVIEPCHVTGEHDPSHTDRYLCGIQKEDLAVALLASLGLAPGDLPHRLHPTGTYEEGGCYWCHHVPGQENDREQSRALHRWAGVEVPPEMAAPADDALREGDDDLVASVLDSVERTTWPEIDQRLKDAGIPMHYGRRDRAVQKLRMECRVEPMRSGTATERLRTPERVELALAQRDADLAMLLGRIDEHRNKYGYAATHDVNRLAAGADESPKIGYDRFKFVASYARWAGYANVREHQGWWLTEKGRELLAAIP